MSAGASRAASAAICRAAANLRAVALQDVLVQSAEMLELLAFRIGLTTGEGEDGDRPGLVLEADVINLEPGGSSAPHHASPGLRQCPRRTVWTRLRAGRRC